MALDSFMFEATSQLVVWLVIVYLCALPLLGILGHMRAREKSPKDFYLAGGTLGLLPLFFTLYATQYSGNTLFGFAGNAYRVGPVILFSVLGMMAVVGSYLIFGKRLHHLAKQHNFITPVDFLRHRYRNTRLTTFINLIFIFALGSYVLTNFKAVGLLTVQLSGGEISAMTGIFGLAVIMGFYESMGGMRSVVWTDMLQGGLLLAGCIGTVVCVLSAFGGPAPLLAELFTNPPPHWQPMNAASWVQGVSIVVLFGAAISLYPHAIQRIYAARDWPVLRRSFILMAAMPFATTLPIVLSALAATLLLPGMEGEADQIIPLLVTRFMQDIPVLSLFFAVFMAAALAAIMSTLDSALLSLGSIFTCDYIRPAMPHWPEARLAFVGRIMSWVLMLAMAGGALILPQNIWSLVVLKFDLLVQVFPAIALGVLSKRIGGRAIVGGLVCGVTTILALRYGNMGINTFGLHSGTIGLAINFAAVFAVHYSALFKTTQHTA